MWIENIFFKMELLPIQHIMQLQVHSDMLQQQRLDQTTVSQKKRTTTSVHILTTSWQLEQAHKKSWKRPRACVRSSQRDLSTTTWETNSKEKNDDCASEAKST